MGTEDRSALVKRYVGIDPGLTGALATLDVYDDGRWAHSVQDVPTVTVTKGKKTRAEYDLPAMHTMLIKEIMKPPPAVHVVAVIEENSPRPGEGVVSAYRIGGGFWSWLALLAVARIPVHRVHPAVWKRAQGLIGTDKNYSRMKARQLFPTAPLDRVKDHGRAEALLIADYARAQGL